MRTAGPSGAAAMVAVVIAFGACSLLGCSRTELESAPRGEPAEVATSPGEDPGAGSIDFLIESKPVKLLTADELMKNLKPLRLEVFEPYERANAVFTAVPLERVLDEAYGPSWRTKEAILFGCRDGYEPTIPVRRILEHQAFLAIDRPGDVGFTILKDEEGTRRRIDLRPFYVIWENLDNARVRTEGDYGWPYQVIRIDLVSFRSRFQEMAPPAHSSSQVQAGFDAFVAHCSKCHAINGRGGAIGPELNYPANPTEYLKEEWLRKWIDDPTLMRIAPRMPPLNPDLPDRTRIIDEIVAYLGAMASHKIEPGAP
ncbi:MAG: cytochrome c [Myxococcales bacterium]|nr:cytochrome c [Myxococcales bacterium]